MQQGPATVDGFHASIATGFSLYRLSSTEFEFIGDGYYQGLIGDSEFTAAAGIGLVYETTELSITEIAPVPLPASLPLLAFGVGAMAFVRRKRRGAPASN